MTTKLTDNKMMAILGKTVILALIPKAIDTAYEFFMPTPVKPVRAKKVIRKKRDGSPLSKEHFDYIAAAFKELDIYNSDEHKLIRLTQADLAIKLNQEFGFNKSHNSYGAVYRNEIKRANLLKSLKPILAGKVVTLSELAHAKYRGK